MQRRQLGLTGDDKYTLNEMLIDGGDRIARILAENARNWEEETYLPKLAQADAKLSGAIASFVHLHWKEASNEITSLVKDRQRAWMNLHGVVAVGMYEFYEHVWAKLRDTQGFEPYEFRLDPLTLALRVFLDDQKRPVALEECESRWLSEKVTEIFMGYVDDIEPRRADSLRQAAKKEADRYRRGGEAYRELVAVLDRVSARQPARKAAQTDDDLRMMYDTLTAMQSRVAKLEASLGVPTVTTVAKRYTKEELDEMSLKEVIDAGVRELPPMRKQVYTDKYRREQAASTTVKMQKTQLEKQYEAYMDVFIDRVYPEFEEFLARKERILATPRREYSRRTLKELDDLLPTGLLFDHWSVATGRDEPVSHTEALQDLRKAVKEALGMERGDWT